MRELRELRDLAEGAWSRYARDGLVEGVRDVVAHSWARSADHVRPDRSQAPMIAEDRARERWGGSPLRVAVDALHDELQRVVGDGDMVAAVTGADGTILWTAGSRWMRDRASSVHFVPGGRWDEASMGTNALGVALETRAPSEVFSAEHYSRAVHDWVCYSAPIVEQQSGRLLGVLDLSTTWDRAHPLALTTVGLLARNLSQLLPDGALDDADDGLALRLLGEPRVSFDGRTVHLPPRQLELLAVLTVEGRDGHGFGLEQLHAALHEGLEVKPSSVKAEVSHLRRRLGDDVIGSRPYRLTVPVRTDHGELLAHLRAGRVDRAVELFAGPLLPGSQAPLLRRHGRFLEEALRRAVLDRGDPDLLFGLGGRLPMDLELHEACLRALPDDDPRASIVHARRATAHA